MIHLAKVLERSATGWRYTGRGFATYREAAWWIRYKAPRPEQDYHVVLASRADSHSCCGAPRGHLHSASCVFFPSEPEETTDVGR